jgi:uncharacterized protein (TIRG00374 family)
MSSLSLRWRQYLRLGIGIAISFLCLYLALKNVDLTGTLLTLSQADWRWLALALVLIAINNLSKAARWKVLLSDRGEKIHFSKALISHMAGQTLNAIFPTRVGDLSRAITVGGMGPGRVYVFGTVMAEKIPDLIALAVSFLVLVVLIPLPEWAGKPGILIVFTALTFTVVMFVILVKQERLLEILALMISRLPATWQVKINMHVQSAVSSLDAFRAQSEFLKLTLWTVVIWLTAMGINYFVFRALSLDLSLTAALFLLLVLQIGIVLPSAPGRIGIFEYICVVCLALFGVGRAEALGYGILLHAMIFLPMAVLGLGFWSFLRSDQPDREDSGHLDNYSKGDPI